MPVRLIEIGSTAIGKLGFGTIPPGVPGDPNRALRSYMATSWFSARYKIWNPGAALVADEKRLVTVAVCPVATESERNCGGTARYHVPTILRRLSCEQCLAFN